MSRHYLLEVKWALIFSLMTLLWMALERAVGLHDEHIDKHMVLTNLYAIPAIAVYVLALRDKRRRDFSGVMSYRQGVVSGALLTVLIALLAPLNQWLISAVVTPAYFENVIAYSVDSGFHATEAEARAYFNLRNYMLQSAIAALLMGLVTTAVVAFFLRSKAPAG